MAELNPIGMFVGDVEYVTTVEAARRMGANVTADMIRDWVKRGLLKPAGRYGGRSNLYRLIDVAQAELRTRDERRGRKRRSGELQKIETVGHNLQPGDVADPAQEQKPRCGVTLNNGRDCRNLADLDAPYDICQTHLRSAYKYWQDYLEAKYAGDPSIPFDPKLDRSREIPPEPTFVYYIQFGTRIKIGYSTNIRQRLGSLPHDEVLALEPGARDLEQMRHKQFMAHRVGANGEWFYDNPDLRSHIKMLVRHFGPADVQMEHLDDRLRGDPVMAPGEDGVLRIVTVHPGVPEDSKTHIHISKVEKS